MSDRLLHVCLIAGEASGDILGAGLMHALKQRTGVRFSGIGGPQMEAEGLQSLFPMRELSVMGLLEVLPRIPQLLRRIKQAAAHIDETKPDIVVTIDSPDFSFRVAEKVKGEKIPMIHYAAPTVWAWRPKRAAKVAALYDGIMCLFPFEPPYFEKEGMGAIFTGHPAAGVKPGDSAAFRKKYDIAPDAPVMGLLFGSRLGEVNRIGPVLREAAVRLAKEKPGLVLAVPTLPHLKREVRNFMRELPCAFVMTDDPAEKDNAFGAMNAALAVSGTVALELAIAGVPHAIAYKMNPLTFQIVKRKVTVRHAHLGNILLDSDVVPEFIQSNCKPENVYQTAKALLDDLVIRERQINAFEKIKTMLGGDNRNTPSEQAATFILELCGADRKKAAA